jgi:LmbE family N-acetylglucosaminyl deacetylase
MRLHVILSPHADDAVWSCGGLILRLRGARERCLVVNVLTAAPAFRDAWHEQSWRACAASMRRPAEDRAALAALGVSTQSLHFVDAALRGIDKPVYGTPAALLSRPAAPDAPFAAEIASALRNWIGARDIVYAPLAGRGSHVDHRLVRSAAELLRPRDLRLYDDFPYPCSPPGAKWRARLEPVDIRGWTAAALRYRSQVLALYGSAQRFAAALHDWARARGAEGGVAYADRIWSRNFA